MGWQMKEQSFTEEKKCQLIMSIQDNGFGGDGGRQPLESALTENTGLEMGQARLRTDSDRSDWREWRQGPDPGRP